MEAQHIVELFGQVAAEVRAAIHQDDDWGLSGNRPGQYRMDVSADAVAVEMLTDFGFGVLSEESGLTASEREVVVVVDPIDGSTNASAGLPWYATSLCAVDGDGPLASLVVNQASGTSWHATRNGGAFRDAVAISPSSTTRLQDALVAVSGLPERHFGWNQFRCYGAAALDICSVADGTFDAYADVSIDAHGVWDYLGAWLVVVEAGGVIVDAHARPLVVDDPTARRTPIAAANSALLSELVTASTANRK